MPLCLSAHCLPSSCHRVRGISTGQVQPWGERQQRLRRTASSIHSRVPLKSWLVGLGNSHLPALSYPLPRALPDGPRAAAAAVAGSSWWTGSEAQASSTHNAGQETASEREDQAAEHAESICSSTNTSTSTSSSENQQHRPTFQTSPSASLTRMLLMAPTPSLRALTNRKWRLSGPTAFLLFMLALFLATMAAVRRVLVRRVKACKTCRGYGIIRCRLCDGQGSVLWRGKVNHEETCPLCLTKRFVTCPDCGGHYHRSMFNHMPSRTGRGLIPDFLLKMNG